MPFLLAEILNFQGSTHRIGVGSFSNIVLEREEERYEKERYEKERVKQVTGYDDCFLHGCWR